MNETYLKLFQEIAHAIELTAEQVLQANSENKDEAGIKAASTMRDDYAALYDRMRDPTFDYKTLTRPDFARLLVGAIIVSQQLNTRIQQEQKVLQGYKVDTIPKLERVVNETQDTEEALKLAEEIFQVSDEN